MDIEKRVTEILCEQLGLKPEQVKPDADLVKDLGADSLDTVELVMTFEEEFSFEMSDEDAERMKNVSNIIEYLKKKIGSHEG